MTQGQGEMRETHPVASEAYRFRTEEHGGMFAFDLEGDIPAGLQSTISLHIESRETGEGICRAESGRTHAFAWAWVRQELHLWLDGALYVFQQAERRRRGGAAGVETTGDILAPMPGAVLEVLVAEGDLVERNQSVVVMESMKMELVITAPRDGVVRRVSVQPGQQVERNMRLLELAPENEST